MKKQSISFNLVLVSLFSLILSTTVFPVSPLGSASEITSTNIRPEAFAANFKTESNETTEKIYPLNPNGLVSVSNLNGSIRLTGWDRPEVKLVTKKGARTPEALESIKVIVDSDGTKFRVKVRYQFDGRSKKWNSNSGAYVNFNLMVPRTAVIDGLESINGSVRVSGTRNLAVVSAVNGSVRAEDVGGQISMESVNGSVNARMSSDAEIRDIRLGSVNGSASVYLPSTIEATVKADTLNGSIRNDFGIPVKKGKYVGSDMFAKIGNGGIKILLSSINGSVNMKRLDNSGTIGAITNLVERRDSKQTSRSLVREVNAEIENTRKKHNELIARLIEKVGTIETTTDDDTKESRKRNFEIATELAGQNIEIAEAEIAEGLKILSRTAGQGRNASYSVETKEFDVGDNPIVDVDAKGVDVSVKSWDKAKVLYRLSRVVNAGVEPVKYINYNETDKSVKIQVKAVPFAGSNTIDGVTLEVFVPKKSQLAVSTERSIRVEGIQGKMNLNSRVGQIDLRDSSGVARLETKTGLIRVIGFDGEIETVGRTGDHYLEGDFESIKSTSRTGRVYLTIPETTNATIVTSSFGLSEKQRRRRTAKNQLQIQTGEFKIKNTGEETWVLGKGGKKYSFSFRTGSLILRSSAEYGG